MQTWNQLLVEEHEWIEKVIAVVETEIAQGQANNPINVKRLSRAIDFLFEIGDKIHNQKEELFLFPRMIQNGIPSQGGPISVMLQEHQAERQILQELSALLPSGKKAFKLTPEIEEKFQSYIQIRKEHIWKENDVLYMMASRVIPPAEQTQIANEILLLDEKYYGQDARAKYQSMVTEIQDMGVSEKPLISSMSYEQIHNLMEALPFEMTFVNEKDCLQYFNRLDKEKIFVRSRSAVGRKVEKCHPEKSVDKVQEIINGFKAGTLPDAEFWINFKGKMVYIYYAPVRDAAGTYKGVLEVTMDITRIKGLEGEKRLLNY